MNIEIKSTLNNLNQIQEDALNIFIEGFHNDFLSFCPDRRILKKLLSGTFNHGSFFVAYMDNNPAGLITYSNNKKRSMTLTEDSCISYLGSSTGPYAYNMMFKEFLKPLDYEDDTAYIDTIITMPEARGKGISKKMLSYLFENLDYNNFILEVGDNNEIALNAYKKTGFVELERFKEEFPKETGYNERIFMKITP